LFTLREEEEVSASAAERFALAPEALELCRVTGPEPGNALQKIVTADLRGMEEGEVRGSLLLHPKGQFRALFAVARLLGQWYLLAPAGKGRELAEKLAAYLRFSRCQVLLEQLPGFLLLACPEGLPAAAWGVPEVPLPGSCFAKEGSLLFGTTLSGVPGFAVLGREAPGGPQLEAGEVELARILRGFPAWGKELLDDVLPQEVGLEEPWVSLRKGCYVGQETVARLATYGHTNRTLVRLAGSGTPEGPGPWPLVVPGDERPVGRLTSWAVEGERGWGLALLRRQQATPGQVLQAQGSRWEVEAVLAADKASRGKGGAGKQLTATPR
jgi:folate-binding protein YgfZ